jgi:TonB-linked SusC/RagA family outer membrane protein
MKKMVELSRNAKFPGLKKLFRIMKLTTFLILISVVCVFASETYSQTKKLNLNMKNATVKEVLSAIEDQSEFKFMYSGKIIDVSREVAINEENSKIEDALKSLFAGTDIDFTIKDRIIVLSTHELKNELFISQQQKTISGKVIDSTGAGLPGASVVVKGTTTGVITDKDGKYTITKIPENAILQFSFVGMRSQETTVGSKTSVNISLVEETIGIEEVVAIGYGTTTRKSSVGAVDQVKSVMLENRPVTDMTQALQGTSANLVIQTREFDPTAKSTNLNIRGVSSLSNNTPLIVIDGIVTDQTALNNLNAMDVDNVSVLKDAGSASIYGSRSANGVILVTTKSGKKNTVTKVRLTAATGLEVPYYFFHPVSAGDNARYRNLANTNSGLAPYFSDAQIADIESHGDHWPVDDLIRTALQQNYNFNVNGGSDKTTYMFSMGYYDQESNLVGNDDFGIKRYTFRTNISTEIGRFKITGILGYARNNYLTTSAGVGGLLGDATTAPPYYTYNMKDAEGHYIVNDKWSEQNPLGQLEAQGNMKSGSNAVNVNLATDFKIIEGLKLRGVFGANVNYETRDTRNHVIQYYYSNGTLKAMRSQSNERARTDNSYNYLLNSQLLLDFNRSFGNHHFSSVAGLTNEAYTSNGSYIEMRYVDPLLGTATSLTNTAGNILGNTYITSGPQLWNLFSYLGRVTYNYSERYFGEVSFRYDSSSKFSKNSRWGFFPAVSLGYRISEEPFMENYREKIGDLKIRGSYGILGNQAVGAYDRYTTYSVNSSGYMFNNSVAQTANFTYGLEDALSWERTHTSNIGVDATFLKNSLFLTLDYFHKYTTDILMNPTVPAVFGASMPKENIGEMKNQGFEFSAKYHLKSGDFIHDINFNIADSKHEVTKYPNTQQISGMAEGKRITGVGLPINSYYGWVVEGIFQNDAEIASAAKPANANVKPGDLRFKDQNDDGKINTDDWVVLGNAFPRFTWGLNYNVSWKSFDFGMFWQGVGKRTHFIRGELMEPFHANYSYDIYEHQLDFWTPENPDAEYPRIVDNSSPSRSNNWASMSSLMIRDTKYARLKNISIGYTLPGSLIRKIGLHRCRVYVDGQNLLTFSPTSFFDPEVSEFDNNMGYGSADSGRHYPSLRYYGFGLDVEF